MGGRRLIFVTDGQQGSDNTALSAFSIGNAQYVYFCGADSAVHELAYGNNGNFSWVDTALPTGGPEGGCPNAVNGMVAFATSPNNQRHVYFRQDGNPSNIRQLYFNGSTWSNQNLTQMIKGAKKAANGIPMSGFAIGNDQYIFFQSPNGHIHEYSYVDSWSDKDLTVATGAGASSLWQGTAAFVVPGTTKMEVYYAAAKAWDLHRMTFQNNKWADTNLTALTGGFVAESPMLGFATTPNDQLHVYLVSGNHDVDQYYFNGADWIDQVLPSVEPDSGEAPSGFSLGNLQYVYYVSFGQ